MLRPYTGFFQTKEGMKPDRESIYAIAEQMTDAEIDTVHLYLQRLRLRYKELETAQVEQHHDIHIRICEFQHSIGHYTNPTKVTKTCMELAHITAREWKK